MLSALDISATGLQAQRIWMNSIAENIANAETTRDEYGFPNPFQRRQPVFATEQVGNATGVSVTDIIHETGYRSAIEPGHPDADPVTGEVKYPKINVVQEMVDMIMATRSYEANVTAMESTKSMFGAAMRILG